MEDEGQVITPRDADYWKLTYRELALLPDWGELDKEARAQKLLEKIEEQINEADAPPQRKALFACAGEERLPIVRRMIEYFENEEMQDRRPQG
jgi:hypothetical protein